jgi:hydroxysqualene dehydroxylase
MNQAVDSMPTPDQTLASTWRSTAKNLAFESIGTVYANAMHPIQMPSCGAWALHANSQCPAQFVFHHPSIAHNSHTQQGQNWLAFVVSACHLDVETLTHQVIHQAALQLGWHITPVKTILEKRATFACSPGLKRPPATIAPKLWAAGDWVQGPYPATIEGAIRSALALDFEASAPN